jgi:hypothetical protein
MWWWSLVGLFLLLLAIGYFENQKAKRELQDYLAELDNCRLNFKRLAAIGQLPILDSTMLNYRLAKNEKLHGIVNQTQNGEEGIKSKFGWGRLLVTNQAIIFEEEHKSQRIPFSSVSFFDLKNDGFILRRRNAKHLSFRTGKNAEILALLDTLISD